MGCVGISAVTPRDACVFGVRSRRDENDVWVAEMVPEA